jgi:hypothetical protein
MLFLFCVYTPCSGSTTFRHNVPSPSSEWQIVYLDDWGISTSGQNSQSLQPSYLLTYSLQRSRFVLEKLAGFQLVKKFPAFYGTRRFITAFTSARHQSLSWASSIQSIPPHHTSWRYILILSSHLRLGLTSGLFPSGFTTKTLYTPLLYPHTR